MKNTYINRTREFLKRNKIFFEIFSSILLSAMALTVSISSYQTTVRQAENEELLNMPLIKIPSEQFSWKGVNDSEKLTIENVGGYAYNFTTNKKVFLLCKYSPLNGGTPKQIYLPINDILDTSSPANNYTGIIEYYYTFCNMDFFHNLYKQSIDIKEAYIEIYLLKYVTVTYNDFKEQLHEDLFIIDGVRQGCKIKKDGNIVNLFSKQYPSYRISEITMEQILELLKVKPE